VLILSLVPAASVQVYVGVPPPDAGEIDVGVSHLESAPEFRALTANTPRARVGGLALTGGDILGLCGLGALALGAGMVLVRAGGRRHSTVS
jgi:hypothetical protein